MLPACRRLVALSVALYALVAACALVCVWRLADGHFVYSLDDPYIHLAVAEKLAHGHYGINALEVSSPSSSVIWPFLLVPFSGTPFHPYLPLVWNLLAGLISATLIGVAVAEWPERWAMDRWRRSIAIVSLLLIGNLVGLTVLGMEHGLQVSLAIGVAFGVCRVLDGRPFPGWCIVAAAVAPSVRYEGLACTLVAGIILLSEGRKRLALGMFLFAVAPLLALAAFLHGHGLPMLPVSVLVKGKAAGAQTHGLQTLLRLAGSGIFHAATDPTRWPLVVLCLMLGSAAWREPTRLRQYALTGATATVGLHLLFGRFGWLHRYEIYALIFGSLIVLRLLAEDPPQRLGWFTMGLLALAGPYASAIPAAVLSSRDVYDQQFQMHRFATEFYRGNVAVNDLGLVSYRLGPSRYVLDLGGLASLETAREPNKDAAWLDGTVRRHRVGLVMVYPGLFSIPATWRKLGTVCNGRPPVAIGGPCVEYYASNPGEFADLAVRFVAFVKTLPNGATAISQEQNP